MEQRGRKNVEQAREQDKRTETTELENNVEESRRGNDVTANALRSSHFLNLQEVLKPLYMKTTNGFVLVPKSSSITFASSKIMCIQTHHFS